MKKLTSAFLLASFLCLFFLGCSAKNSRSTDYLRHTVTSQGETIAQISKWYTGRSSNWQEIMKHNPMLDARKIRIGTVIDLPRNLITRDKPMPKIKQIIQDPTQASVESGGQNVAESSAGLESNIPLNTADDVEIAIDENNQAASEQIVDELVNQ